MEEVEEPSEGGGATTQSSVDAGLDTSTGGPLGERLERLNELAKSIQSELKLIRSEGASSEHEDGAEGVRGSPLSASTSLTSLTPTTPTVSAPFGSLGRAVVQLNVGGRYFATTLSTLTKSPHSMLGAMFSGRFALTTDDKNRYFIDRDGTHFGTILNFLRDGFVVLPESEQCRAELLIEAQYYQLAGLIDLLTPEEKIQCTPWRWSPGSKSAYITLVNNFATARAGEGKNWNTVLADSGYSSGRHYFEMEVVKYNNSGGGWGISFGLVDVLHDFEYNHFGHRDNLPKGTRRTWSYVAATGKVYERGVEMFAGRPFSVNDRVGLLLDWKHHIVQFFSNGEPEGPGIPFSWSPDDPPLFPAMSLNGGGDKFHVTIVSNPKLPTCLLRKQKE